MGAIGVTGTVGRQRARRSRPTCVLAVGTRLQDFTTGSWALFKAERVTLIGLNTQPFDAVKHRALPLVADARAGLQALSTRLGGWQAPPSLDRRRRKRARPSGSKAAAHAARPRPTPRCPRTRR